VEGRTEGKKGEREVEAARQERDTEVVSHRVLGVKGWVTAVCGWRKIRRGERSRVSGTLPPQLVQ